MTVTRRLNALAWVALGFAWGAPVRRPTFAFAGVKRGDKGGYSARSCDPERQSRTAVHDLGKKFPQQESF